VIRFDKTIIDTSTSKFNHEREKGCGLKFRKVLELIKGLAVFEISPRVGFLRGIGWRVEERIFRHEFFF